MKKMKSKNAIFAKQAGLYPGTLIHIGEKKQENTRIRLIYFDSSELQEMEIEDIKSCLTFKDKPGITWINIDGLHDTILIEEICSHYGIHPLVQEDVVHTGQRPKREFYENYNYFVFRMLSNENHTQEISDEQLSLILGHNYMITFQEQAGDVFNLVRERLRVPGNRIRTRKVDYLAYALMDTVVDHYFIILDSLNGKLDVLDNELFDHPSKNTLQKIYDVKRGIISVRKSIWPLREIMGTISREEAILIDPTTQVFFKDIHDHIIQVVDSLDTFREIVNGMLDAYMTHVSNKMNEVMKVLTIIATIFIPITFVAGIYGMNF